MISPRRNESSGSLSASCRSTRRIQKKVEHILVLDAQRKRFSRENEIVLRALLERLFANNIMPRRKILRRTPRSPIWQSSFIIEYIMGQKTEADWEGFKQSWNEMGGEAWTNEVNEQYASITQ